MSRILENLKYSTSHEWVKVEGNIAYIGITDYAQESLGNIVYLEVNDIDDTIAQFDDCGVIESVKAASDLKAPLSGRIIEHNESAIDEPEILNADAYANWILKIEMSNPDELNNLLDAAAYATEIE